MLYPNQSPPLPLPTNMNPRTLTLHLSRPSDQCADNRAFAFPKTARSTLNLQCPAIAEGLSMRTRSRPYEAQMATPVDDITPTRLHLLLQLPSRHRKSKGQAMTMTARTKSLLGGKAWWRNMARYRWRTRARSHAIIWHWNERFWHGYGPVWHSQA